MIPKTNFHTHTTYCDGKHTASEMAAAAYAKGFTRLGFSGHGYTAFDESYCMSRADVSAYLQEVAGLKAEYAGKMEIDAGVEQDFYATEPTEGFAYVIGSVHYLYQDGRYLPVDEAEAVTAQAVREHFGGTNYRYVQAYFETVAQVVAKTHADIIGHFDLVTKFNEGGKHFDMTDKRFWHAGLEAMEELLRWDKPFEINTGAMYRGLRTEPYPSLALLKELQKRGGRILLSSDSHDTASLGYGFAEMARAAKELGFRPVQVWTPQGWEETPL